MFEDFLLVLNICITHEKAHGSLCLFTDARLAPDLCFTEVNKAGDTYGNCGKNLMGIYRACTER